MASSGQWTAKLDGLEVKSGGYTEVRLPEQIDEGWRGAVLGGLGREGDETTSALGQGHTASANSMPEVEVRLYLRLVWFT